MIAPPRAPEKNRSRTVTGVLSFETTSLHEIRNDTAAGEERINTGALDTSMTRDAGVWPGAGCSSELLVRNYESRETTLNGSVTSNRATSNELAAMNERLSSIETKLISVEESNEELKRLIASIAKDNFSIKGSNYEIPLKVEIAKLFCTTISRKPSKEAVRLAVTKIITSQVVRQEPFKFDVARKFVLSKLSDYRTEERRKCLGMLPYKHHSNIPTHQLAAGIIKSIKGTADHETAYVRHLALFRLFIRHCNTKAQATHNFNSWVLEHYNPIQEEEWKTIMESDTAYNYEVLGHGLIEITAQH